MSFKWASMDFVKNPFSTRWMGFELTTSWSWVFPITTRPGEYLITCLPWVLIFPTIPFEEEHFPVHGSLVLGQILAWKAINPKLNLNYALTRKKAIEILTSSARKMTSPCHNLALEDVWALVSLWLQCYSHLTTKPFTSCERLSNFK